MRTVVITGATSGFGYLMVGEFLKAGDRVIATGRKLKSRPEVFQAERQNFGERLIEMDLDVVVAEQRSRFAEYCRSLPAGVDILVNNAGYGLFGPLEDSTDEQIREQMEVNFFGTSFLCRDLLPALRKAQGKIFNFSSVFGFMGFPLTSLYCASKFAVEGLSESLRYELAPHGVQVCLIEPGGYRTKFAQNLAWADTQIARGSAYKTQILNYQKLRDKMTSRPKGPDPLEVAQGLVRLSQKKKIPLRKVFGTDAKASHFFRRLTPSCWQGALLGRLYRKLFLRPVDGSA